MNETNTTSGYYRLMPTAILTIFLLGACSGGVRYDETTRAYSSPQSGVKVASSQNAVKSTSSQYADTTARYASAQNEGADKYSEAQSGVTSSAGKYDDVTARYTLRQGGSSEPRDETIRTYSAPPEEPVSHLTMVIETDNVLFDFDKWVIKDGAKPELDKWVDYFRNNPMVTAEIYGHTDSTGTVDYNQELSEKRAQAVINYLFARGIDGDRLTARGFGELRPIVSNDSDEGRRENRRVEVGF